MTHAVEPRGAQAACVKILAALGLSYLMEKITTTNVELNFTGEFDISPGCYLTNYLIAAQLLAFAYKFYHRIPGLQAEITNTDNDKSRILQTGDHRKQDNNNNTCTVPSRETPLRKSKSVTFREDSFLLNRRMFLILMTTHNICNALALISSGLVHHVFHDETTLACKFFWNSTQMWLALGFFCFSFHPLLLTYKIESNSHSKKIYTVLILVSLIFGIEEYFITALEFAKTLLLAFLTLGLSSLYATIKSERILDPSLKFRPKVLYTSLVVIFSFMIYYATLIEGCGVPKAYGRGNCPFPDRFNHNAVLHVMLFGAMYGINSSFNAS